MANAKKYLILAPEGHSYRTLDAFLNGWFVVSVRDSAAVGADETLIYDGNIVEAHEVDGPIGALSEADLEITTDDPCIYSGDPDTLYLVSPDDRVYCAVD